MIILDEIKWNEFIQKVMQHFEQNDSSSLNINFCSTNGNTIFHMAARSQNVALLSWLLTNFPEKGVDFINNSSDISSVKIGFNTQNALKKSPLAVAIETNNFEICRLLIRNGASLDQQIFNFVIDNIQLDRVKLLIALQVSPNLQNQNKVSILHSAIMNNLPEVVNFLIKNGADLEIKDSQGRTPLHYAIQSGYSQIATLIESNKIDLEATDNMGYTPLLRAIDFQQRSTATMLLNKGVKVNSKYSYDQTALHLSIIRGNSQLTFGLLKRDADPNAEDKESMTPIHYAVKFEREEIVKFLLETNSQIDINKINKMGMTPLHFAVFTGNINIVKLLLEYNAITSTTNYEGKTTLHSAVEMGNLEIVKMLLEKGVDHTIKDHTGRTAFILAKDLMKNAHEQKKENLQKIIDFMQSKSLSTGPDSSFVQIITDSRMSGSRALRR